ncbi:MAG TPA: PRTRC system protein C [Dehalococcoidales bacterium]|nr:PRTRC system protein C [Dehalococcoidales bacterium]
MSRVFVYDGREFDDPDANLSADEVRQQMTSFFPELANAEVTQSERDSESEPGTKDTIYEFRRRVGTKGAQ